MELVRVHFKQVIERLKKKRNNTTIQQASQTQLQAQYSSGHVIYTHLVNIDRDLQVLFLDDSFARTAPVLPCVPSVVHEVACQLQGICCHIVQNSQNEACDWSVHLVTQDILGGTNSKQWLRIYYYTYVRTTSHTNLKYIAILAILTGIQKKATACELPLWSTAYWVANIQFQLIPCSEIVFLGIGIHISTQFTIQNSSF